MYTNYERVKRWRKQTKERLIEAFGGSCGICGYNKCVWALNLHHIIPIEKDFNFRGKCRSWEKIVIEARKCVLLCSNCHDEIHAGVTELPNNIKRFDESFAQRSFIDNVSRCPICGKEKSIRNITCSSTCASKHRYKLDWNNIDLISMYEELKTYTAVALKLGVSDQAIRKRILNLLRPSSSSG